MAGERDFIASLLAPIANTAPARGLKDDAAVWTPPLGRDLVFTHDVLACGVHYLASDPPSDIAWKLLAVNLSDLAAMGAAPAGVLMGLGLSAAEGDAWRRDFAAGLARAMAHFGVALWGGDTVAGLEQAVLGLTAIGTVTRGAAIGRAGALVGDDVWVSGTIGDAGLGLAIAQGGTGDRFLLKRFRRPEPRLALGQALAGLVSAGMDISDGLLIDADRLGRASGCRLVIDLASLPLSLAVAAITHGDEDRLVRATAGDDYELLFTAPPVCVAEIEAAARAARTPVARIGRVEAGIGVSAIGASGADITPERLGWEH